MSVINTDVPERGCWMSVFDREELFDQGVEHGINVERLRATGFYYVRLRAWSLLTGLLGFGAGVLLAPLFS